MPAQVLANRLKVIRSKQPWLVLGAANTYSVACSDHPAISHYYSFEANGSESPIVAIPDGCVEVLFDCSASQSTAKVFGTPTEAMDTGIVQGHRYFGVRFALGIVPDCMQASAEEIVNGRFNLVDIVPHTQPLIDRIIHAASFSDQKRIFNHFFDTLPARPVSGVTQSTVHTILARNGNVRIDELALATGFSIRTLQRQFNADMGMSPKAFSRIIRCQSAVYGINHCERLEFSEMAFRLGFSDQSHFQREFKKCVQVTPMTYQKQVKQQTYLDRIEFL